MNLQISGSPLVCNMIMWNSNIEMGFYPTWFAELHLPFDEPGVYDLAEVGGYIWVSQIQEDTGGGSGGDELYQGIVEITHVDGAVVIGSLSGLIVYGINGVDYDLNGTFEAIRCTQDAWLDAHPGAPHDPPLPEGCLHP
jgi:hypothetical protein